MQWDAWGNRVDRIEVTPLWRKAERIAAEQRPRRHRLRAQARRALARAPVRARLPLHALDRHLQLPARDDRRRGARAARASGNEPLIERAVPRLTSRDPEQFWTSGQWMTGATGGSDVGASRDRRAARRRWQRRAGASTAASGSRPRPPRRWRSRSRGPEGQSARRARPRALLSSRRATRDGRLHGIRVNRLKDKLGTRKVPTAELTLDGAPAELGRGHVRRRAEHRADAQRHAHLEQRQRGRR